MFQHKLLSCVTTYRLQGAHWIKGNGKQYTQFRLSGTEMLFLSTFIVWQCVYTWIYVAFCLIENMCIYTWSRYLVSWHQVDQHSVQQLLRHGVSLTDDGAHQVHHMHVHFLVVAVARETRREIDKGQDWLHCMTFKYNIPQSYSGRNWNRVALVKCQIFLCFVSFMCFLCCISHLENKLSSHKQTAKHW